MADQISICNMALAEIVAEPIESLNERSLGARETGRYYDQALQSLLEAHPWGFATRRATLPPTINSRPGEWQYAYAMPGKVARPLKLIPTQQASFARWWVTPAVPGVPYVIEDGLLYCSISEPLLAYIASDVTAASFPAKFVDALALELAARIVMPIKKSREMKGDLIRQAEVARQRAMADDVNRQPVADEWVDEVDAVRNGGYWAGWSEGSR